MKRSALILGLGLLLLGAPSPSNAQDTDLFDNAKSDTNIKRFVFPKSMVVIRYCYPFCVVFSPGQGMLGLAPELEPKLKPMIEVLDNEKAIKKYLVKLDPVRIAPSKRGEDLRGEALSKPALQKLGKKYDVDFILVFRRLLYHTFVVGTEGLIYLVPQNKVLMIPLNRMKYDLKAQEFEQHMEEVNGNGLEQLGKQARKIIHAHKYEKLQSAY